VTNAIVLLKITKDRINEVAQAIVDLDGVTEVGLACLFPTSRMGYNRVAWRF